jgi:RNA polymerase sigma-54 factor
MMHMDQRLVQTQRLMLTQKMQQAIQILQLSSLELEQHVQQELETNPVLDLITKEPEQPAPIAPTAQIQDTPPADEPMDLDYYLDTFRREPGATGRNADNEARRDYYENSITKEESFTSRLLTQLRLADVKPSDFAIGERIIGEIDNRGYFTGTLEEIAKDLNAPLEACERVLHRIQKFEPTGVGARDVVECLLLQIAVEYPNEPQLSELVEKHLDDLEHRQIPKIARAMGVTAERVEELRDLLARLNPWPGHEYSTEPTQYVQPDVIVEKIDEEFVVYLADDTTPELRINNTYVNLLRKTRAGSEEKRYIRGKMESARWLIRNIEQRKNTILRIAIAIVEAQKDFMEKGVEFIKPLTLQQIADVVNVHEATVSRATRGKYMQTPQGLFEMKYFFSPGLQRDTGESQSSKSVQSVLQRMIDEEDKNKPLSDQKIADLLKVQGLNIARRTVTKYREALNIPPTNLRRSYTVAEK